MKIKLPHQLKHLRWHSLLRILPPIIATALLLLLGWSIMFLYNYFYQTIAEVKVVYVLKSQVALNQVDIPLYKQVFDTWDAKKKYDSEEFKTIRDPFQPIPPTPPSNIPSIEQANTPANGNNSKPSATK